MGEELAGDDKPIERQYVVAEIALILSLNEETVRVKLRAGNLRGKNVDGIWRVPKSEIARYLEEGSYKPEASNGTSSK
jgi:hypothetical protein